VQGGFLALELNHLSVNVIRLRDGQETPVTDGLRHDFDPDFSRDGVLAFTSSQDDSWIYVQSPGGEPRRVAQLDMNAPRRVRWSPDGRELALIGEVDSRQRIFIADAATGRTREVRTPDLIPQGVDWSNDGASLVFAAADDTGTALWRISLEAGSRPRQISEYGWIDVVESPDGLFAEALPSPLAQARPPGVYRLDRPEGPQRLTPELAVPGGLRWVVFNSRLYFIATTQAGTQVSWLPVSGGPVNVIATISPNVDYGLSVDPLTGDLAYARTDRTNIDIAIAPLRPAR
jgi:dipeptidyl aminopeptidase/acylaminoacyl peptidase